MSGDHPSDEKVAQILKDTRFDFIITEEDKAYAAGIIDGEGCVSIDSYCQKDGTVSHRARVSVRMVDHEAIIFLKRKFGGTLSLMKAHPSRNHRDCFQWYISNAPEIMQFCKRLLPYLRVKRKRAELVIEFCQGIPRRRMYSQKGTQTQRLPKEEVDRRNSLTEAIRVLNRRGANKSGR